VQETTEYLTLGPPAIGVAIAAMGLRMDQSDSPMAGLRLDTAIHLRWVLRDIKGKRTKMSPVSPNDLGTLIEMGLVEMQDEVPVLTNEGHRAIK
jgi:hypothetical protein